MSRVINDHDLYKYSRGFVFKHALGIRFISLNFPRRSIKSSPFDHFCETKKQQFQSTNAKTFSFHCCFFFLGGKDVTRVRPSS